MKHLGDITKINGAEIPPVDVITGGSPCQDLSVAGARKGLAGERSGLFMEQIRIVKEMRERDRRSTDGYFRLHPRPRWLIWENVPGAFSSNKGKDFQAVLTEIAKIIEPECPDVPIPERGGWSKSGCLMGIGETGQPFSIAWRVHDAQFWGVPQRRKRIALVADFGGLGAPEVLFERKGVSGNTAEGSETGEGTSEDAARRADETSRAISFQERAGKPGGGKGILIQNEKTGTLSTFNNQSVYKRDDVSVSITACGGSYGGRSEVLAVSEPTLIEMSSTKNTIVESGVSPTLTSRAGTGGNQVNAICIGNGQVHDAVAPSHEVSKTLNCMDDPMKVMVSENLKARNVKQTVRRLTPLECTRLQGYPDGWVDIGDWTDSKGKTHKDSDSPKYKALGNSIALPFWQYLARRICAQYERDITVGSLFDGIGGFPYVFERCGAKAVWASEIEEFPIAVTKRHFPEEGEEK